MSRKAKARWITWLLCAAALCAVPAKAVDFYFDNSESNSLWSTVNNWHDVWSPAQTNTLGIFPNSISNAARIAQTNESTLVTTTNIAILDGDYTVMNIAASWGMRNGAAKGLAKITSPGGFGLTIDGTAFTGDAAGNNAFGNWAGPPSFNFGQTGSRFEIDVSVTITNGTGNQLTWVRNDNSAYNETAFTPNGSLTLLNPLGVVNGAGGKVEINCPMLPSQAELIIQTDILSFNAGHDSSNFGRDMVMQGTTSKLTVNGGTVLSPFRKIQVNSPLAEIELNGANVINGADIVIDVGNDLLLDVNANQENMGRMTVGQTVTIDLDETVTNLQFADCSSNLWSGSLTISNFVSEVVRFGTNSLGLSIDQLSVMSAYDSVGTPILDLDINESGYLTGTVSTDTPDSLYADWVALYPTLANSSKDYDAEPDGVINLFEYALGGNPTNDDAVVISPSYSMVDIAGTTWLVYVYNRRLDAAARGLTYTVLSGTDLTAGPLATPTIEVGSGAINAQFESVTNAVSTTAEDVQFMGLSIEFTN